MLQTNPDVLEFECNYTKSSQIRDSKLAKFSNSRFWKLLFSSKLAVKNSQIREFADDVQHNLL